MIGVNYMRNPTVWECSRQSFNESHRKSVRSNFLHPKHISSHYSKEILILLQVRVLLPKYSWKSPELVRTTISYGLITFLN